MKDSFGREINYLRISLTDRCNLRCEYCMPGEGIDNFSQEEILTLDEIYTIARVFVQLGVNKIRLTGGEPIIRPNIVELVHKISKLEGLKDLSITTNGILLKDFAKPLKEAGLNRVNISLDTLDSKKYKEITRGGNLSQVLDGIEEAKKVGLTPIKINTVLIGGFNDDEIEDLVKLTEKEEIDVRFIELMPIGQAIDWSKEKFLSNDIIIDRIKELHPVPRNDKSSPAVYYKLPNGKGNVGIINPISCKFCQDCNRVRLTSRGQLKLCLHSNLEIDLRTALRNGEDLKKLIIESIEKKEESHHLEDGKYIRKNMNQIGG